MTYEAVVIGGGAAGLLCGAIAAKNGKSTVILEKNALPAKKLRITGKGRCNITNSRDISEFIENVNSNPTFLYSAFYSFTNHDVMNLFESLDVPLKEERGGRVFPVSDKAVDIAEALISYAKSNGAKIFNKTVKKIDAANNEITSVLCNDNTVINTKSVVIATGGVSYPLTGSTGDGYKFAKELGHTVIPPTPSLVPLITEENWPGELAGLSLKNIEIKIKQKEKIIFSDFGEMLFTHNGISGPVVLTAGARLKNIANGKYTAHIDLKPALTEDMLNKRIIRDFDKYINKNLSNALFDLLPQKLIPVIIETAGLSNELKVHQITKSERLTLVEALKNLSLTIEDTAPIKEAIITRGGVCTKEIDPSTMQSKIVKGLYFAGEVIDVDAYTGGYNLQIAFSTGFLAGNSI